MPEQENGSAETLRTLCDFIRSSHEALIEDWTERVRKLSPARELSAPALVDHIPEVLTRLADMVEGKPVALAEVPKKHAIDRLAHGFDLEQVIKEFSVLRQCILACWERSVGPSMTVSELRQLDTALDQSIADSCVSFARARERMLGAVDRISEAAIGTADLDAFLQKILQATLETTEAVDTAAVFLRDGELLRMRAAVGLEEQASRGFAVKLGEGVAGKVAIEGRPILLRNAATDPLVEGQSIREKGVHALYGVPLIHASSVLGVAYMGSRTAFEFSDEDKLLFRTMASRATTIIVQTHLINDLEKTLADRDRLVSQLASERVRLEDLLNHIPTGILIADAPTAEISFVNKRCQELLGHSLDPGAPASHFNNWKLFHLDGREYEAEQTPRRRALRGEYVVDEVKVQRPDGSWVTVRMHAAPVRDPVGQIQSAVIAFDDVSGQKRYEHRLRFLAEASRQLAESIDYDTTLTKIAQVALAGIADWFGVDLLRDGELRSVAVAHPDPIKVKLAKEFRSRFPPDLKASRGLAKVLRDGQPELYAKISDEMIASGARGEEHLELMRALGMKSAMIVPLNVRGQTIGAVTFAATAESGRRYDRDDLEMAQGFADRAGTAIENARLLLEAERAIRLREEVLAVVSHDLRNPLSSINMSAALLLKKVAADPRMRKQVEAILRATGRMERLIGDLLDMASIQAGRLAVEREAQEIAPIIIEAVETAEPLAKANGQTLSSEISVGAARCSVDKERILQLFSNLLGNAKKFSPSDGTIMVRASVNGNEVECSVSDTGPGIPPKDLPHIFDPYWSANNGAKKSVGLGLYITKGIVEAHGGRIWVENQVDSGAVFYFTLPLA